MICVGFVSSGLYLTSSFDKLYSLSPILLLIEHFSMLIIKTFILFLLIGHSHCIRKDSSHSSGVTYETMADTG